VAKQTSSAAWAEQTAKGKKIATWALTSRHHNSHPQLPSTRPKKALPDRGAPSFLSVLVCDSEEFCFCHKMIYATSEQMKDINLTTGYSLWQLFVYCAFVLLLLLL